MYEFLLAAAVEAEREALQRHAHGLTVIVTGAGPAAAAAGTALVLAAAPYDLVVSAGSAAASPARAARLAGRVLADRRSGPGRRLPRGLHPRRRSSASAPRVDAAGRRSGPRGHAALATLAAGAGPVLTVTTATGTAGRAAELLARHPGRPAEAMEGFGVAEAADQYGLPVLEIRAVSNAIGPRDRGLADRRRARRPPGAFEKLPAVLESWTTA